MIIRLRYIAAISRARRGTSESGQTDAPAEGTGQIGLCSVRQTTRTGKSLDRFAAAEVAVSREKGKRGEEARRGKAGSGFIAEKRSCC